MEFEPVNGQRISKRAYSGAQDDAASRAVVTGGHLYVAGESKSFAEGGNAVGQSDVLLLDYAANPSAAPALLTVPIDIKPGSAVNSLNPQSQGKIPLAVLSTRGFAAPTMVTPDSLTFGRLGTEASLASCSPEDVNRDGRMDLLCHFHTAQAAFQPGDTQGILKGLTTSGAPLKGTDAIRLVPCSRR